MAREMKGNKLTTLAALIGALPDCNPASAAAGAAAADSKANGTGTRKGRKAVRDLNYQMKAILLRNRDGSESTQANRWRLCMSIANDLGYLGFKNLDIHNLKQKHVKALIDGWRSRNLTAGAQKNYMVALRWICEKIGKPNLIARSNDAMGIQKRSHLPTVSKGKDVVPDQLARITDPYIVLSLRLQAAFGLRREESMKFTPSFADHGDKIVLKASWCKGGRERPIPVRTIEQRALLNEVKALAGKGSLIPAELQYKDQLQRYKHQCQKAGISFAHGHRHWYAQERYRELTGWNCPVRGGPKSNELSREQKAIDHKARMTISAELGHGREQITVNYLGR
jgi:hypothetical protein